MRLFCSCDSTEEESNHGEEEPKPAETKVVSTETTQPGEEPGEEPGINNNILSQPDLSAPNKNVTSPSDLSTSKKNVESSPDLSVPKENIESSSNLSTPKKNVESPPESSTPNRSITCESSVSPLPVVLSVTQSLYPPILYLPSV